MELCRVSNPERDPDERWVPCGIAILPFRGKGIDKRKNIFIVSGDIGAKANSVIELISLLREIISR